VEIRSQLLSTRARAFVLKRPQGWRWPWHCSGEDVTTWSSTRETNHSISGLRDTVRSNVRRLKALLTQNSTSLFSSHFFLLTFFLSTPDHCDQPCTALAHLTGHLSLTLTDALMLALTHAHTCVLAHSISRPFFSFFLSTPDRPCSR